MRLTVPENFDNEATTDRLEVERLKPTQVDLLDPTRRSTRLTKTQSISCHNLHRVKWDTKEEGITEVKPIMDSLSFLGSQTAVQNIIKIESKLQPYK